MSQFAVIKTGGKQYQVSVKDKLKVEKLKAEKGDEVVFDTVLLLGDDKGNDIKLGTPVVDGAKVKAKVLSQSRAKKVTVLKYKSKTRYRRKVGHHQQYTEVEIKKIEG